jgi:hypothetical protein
MRDTERDLERLDEALRQTPELSADLFSDVTEHCTRLSSLRQSGKAIQLDRMIEAGAWTDAAITLTAFELPNWNVRRIVCEDGEWLCSLSQHPSLPIVLDEPVERSHPVLALAILRAFMAVRRKGPIVQQATASVPQVRPSAAFVFCCDNFA